jgi:acyl-CoA dehydrogenase
MTTHESTWTTDDVRSFRATARQFIQQEFVPRQAHWRQQQRPDLEAWSAAGRAGLLLADVPEQYGGGGGTFAHEAVVLEELARAGVDFASSIQSIVAHYVLAYGTEPQKQKWLPRLADGTLVGAIAMTEPGAGSDLQGIRTIARREHDGYVLNGSKTFITNGPYADTIVFICKLDEGNEAADRKVVQFVLDSGMPGLEQSKPLRKMGLHSSPTGMLFLDDVRCGRAGIPRCPRSRARSARVPWRRVRRCAQRR